MEDRFLERRKKLVKELEFKGITDKKVLNAILKVKREEIAQVLLESLSRGRDGLYIIGLKIIAT